MKTILLICFLLLLLTGCGYFEFGGTNIRFAIESTASQASTATVVIEGRDGNLVTGANVIVSNSTAVSSVLKFSFSDGVYTAALPPGNDGAYTFTIQSALFTKPYVQTIEHFILSGTPQITLLQDESAHSMLAGSKLNAVEKINVQWFAVAQATNYLVQISGDAFYSATVTTAATTIPVLNAGAAGTYYIIIKAQYISGDPLFAADNYYSFSEKAGSSVLILTQ